MSCSYSPLVGFIVTKNLDNLFNGSLRPEYDYYGVKLRFLSFHRHVRTGKANHELNLLRKVEVLIVVGKRSKNYGENDNHK